VAAAALRDGTLSAEPPAAIVLPPREGFSPGAVGAVGLLVHRLASPDDLVLGRPTAAAPFPDRRFEPVVVPRLSLARLAGDAGAYAEAAARRIRQLRTPPLPALVEVHNRPEVALALARRLPGLPVSVILHNDPQGMRRARTAGERAELARHVRVVAVSEYLRRRFLQDLAEPVKVAVLPNCLDLAALPPRLPAEGREPLILFAGRLVADKGADGFVAACARALPHLPGWRAEMIGADRFRPDSPDTPFLESLRPAAAAAGIRLHGYQPSEIVLAAMARAAIVVVPSRWAEPFGLTALEAMASGAALLAGRRGGLAELTEGASLPADPDEPEALAASLRRLAADADARRRLSEAGLERAKQYDLPAARARLVAFRHALLGHAGSRGGDIPAEPVSR